MNPSYDPKDLLAELCMAIGLCVVVFILACSLSGCAQLGMGQPKGLEFGLKIDLAKAPTAKEASFWRQSQPWKKFKEGWVNAQAVMQEKDSPVLINGSPVDKKNYPAVIQITGENGAGCTASIVGPRAILTAAHCAATGKTVSFTTVHGDSYTATMTRFKYWPGTDLDLSVGKVDKEIKNIKPLTVRTDRFEKKGLEINLIGYGCTRPGGGGGNDGVLRLGSAKVSGAQGFDLALDANPSALCYGDSGGPVLYEGQQIGVNSKGNIKNYSFTTRTTLIEAKQFLKQVAEALAIEIVGITGK